MRKLLISAIAFVVSVFPVFGEVEYEIHTGYDSAICTIRGVDLESEGRILELRTYHAAPGKLDALLSRFRDHTCKLFVKHKMINVGYWVPAENPDNLLIYLVAHSGKDSCDASWKAFMADPEWKSVQAASETEGRLVAKVDRIFLTPTDFSEGFAKIIPSKANDEDEGAAETPTPEHLFEMRTYTATPGHLPNLHARFRDHTMELFTKHGITNLAYFQFTPDQPDAENILLYFLSHKDMESAVKSWDGFRADPEWIEAKMASEKEASGSLTAHDGVKSVFLKPTDFSPVK